MSPVRRLAGSNAGATAVEFALVAPLFFAFLLGLIEISRLLWTSQVVQRAAHEAVRCLAIGQQCQDEAAAQAFAIEIGRESGVAIPLTAVTADTPDNADDVECNGMADQNRVAISIPFETVVPNILPMLPEEIGSTACFPRMN